MPIFSAGPAVANRCRGFYPEKNRNPRPFTTATTEAVMSPVQPDPKPTQDLLTARQVAHRLAIGVRTLWRMVAAGRLPQPIRYTRKLVRWKASDIDRYVRGLSA